MSNDPVVLQLEAYNARDIERFVKCFTEDVIVEDASGTRVLTGIEAFRTSYAAMFAASPALHCRVMHRMRAGSFVVDEERVTGRGDAELHVIVVYTLREAKGSAIEHLIAAVRVLR